MDKLALSLRTRLPACAILDRVRATMKMARRAEEDLHRSAVSFCRSWDLPVIEVAPSDYFSWDGRALATCIEPTVLIHEIAHFQVCAPERRHLIDFGLGAGPETGRKAEADQDQRLFGIDADLEEALASMLGIMWEAELGHPAIDAFLEQNWLEGGDRPENVHHFDKICRRLFDQGLVGDTGRPQRQVRTACDPGFYEGLRA